MPKKDDDYGALLAAGLLAGVGLLAASSAGDTRAKRRQNYRSAVADELRRRGFELRSMTLVRRAGNRPFWRLIADDATRQPWTLEVPVAKSADPFSTPGATLAETFANAWDQSAT